MGEISIIAAMGDNRVIGKNNALPWHIPEDFKWFRERTKGKTVLMGQSTHESIGKKLPGRLNIVLSTDKDYISPHEGVLVFDSLSKAIELYSHEEEIMIIGGAQIYKAGLPFATKLYITRIYAEFDGDAFFPEYEDKWEVVETEFSGNDKYNYEFQILKPRVCDEPQGGTP